MASATEHGLDWWLTALHGVDKPTPASLAWLKDQGAWYTPFNHPGMAGPYDLRGWHGKDDKDRKGSKDSKAPSGARSPR